ncbi:methyl-accepting chemotaxis protein [Desulfobacterales bacterium HSG16]|nr:methyl-accepting chemotaxis protein [Desulfobacterales bacterium HSG16]
MNIAKIFSGKFRISLSLKTIVIVVITSTILLSGFGWYRYQEASSSMNKTLQEVLTLSGDRMALSLRTPLNNFNDQVISAVVAAEMKSRLIAGVFIMDKEYIQFGFLRNEAGDIVTTENLLSEKDGYMLTERDIAIEGMETLGRLKIFVTRHYLEQDLQRLLIATFIEVAAMDIMLLVVLTLFIRFVVIKPLNRLACLITKVSCGDFSEHSDILTSDSKRGDELGKMTRAVREMIGNLSQVLKETDDMIRTVQNGRLDIRGNTETFEGGWKELVAGVNRLIDAFTDPISVTAENLDRLAKGEIPEKITKEYNGDFSENIDNLNRLIGTTEEITEIAENIGGGNMLVDASERSANDRLMKALNSMIKGLQGTIRVAEKIAEGDLSVQVKILSEEDILGKSLNKMIRDLTRFAISVQRISEQVATGSEQISSTAELISQGTSQQAASIEEISASIEEMSSIIGQNADNARQTAVIAAKAAQNAQEGGKAMGDTVLAMESISEKIMIIDEIARQTAMLSLNASIEAARAQEHGKGFAVVAQEVGKLSKRTQQAAKAINELSVSNIEIAGSAGIMIKEMVTGIRQTADLVQEISASCSEQAGGIDQVNTAIQQLDQVIQHNAASTEEMASGSRDFASQAEGLLKSVSFFNFPEDMMTEEEAAKESVKKLEQAFQDEKIQDAPSFFKFLEKIQNGEYRTGDPKFDGAMDVMSSSRMDNANSQIQLQSPSSEMTKNGTVIDLSETESKDFIKY